MEPSETAISFTIEPGYWRVELNVLYCCIQGEWIELLLPWEWDNSLNLDGQKPLIVKMEIPLCPQS